VLLAACFNELKDRKIISAAYALEQQLGIYEILVNYYPKKLYFFNWVEHISKWIEKRTI